MITYDDVLDAAQSLPPTDRVRLIDALWETVPPEAWAPPSKEWIAKAQGRSAEYDAGQMPASPWPEVQQRARRKAGLDG